MKIHMALLCAALSFSAFAPSTADAQSGRYFARQHLHVDALKSAVDPDAYPSHADIATQVAWVVTRLNAKVAVEKAGGPKVGTWLNDMGVGWIRHAKPELWWHYNHSGQWVHGWYQSVFIADPTSGGVHGFGEVCARMAENGRPCTNYGSEGTHVVFSYT